MQPDNNAKPQNSETPSGDQPDENQLPASGFERAAVAPAEAVQRREELRQARRQARLVAPISWVEPAVPLDRDTLWRSLTREGEARLLVVRATQAVREAAARMHATPDVAKLVAELMIGALLVRSTINPDERLQLYLNHEGPLGQVAIEAWDDGGVRAYVAHPEESNEIFGLLIGAGSLQISRALGTKHYASSVALNGENVSDYLMHYLLESEQILSLVHTDVRLGADGQVQSASGYLLQMMPEGTRNDLRKILHNIQGIAGIGDAMTADDPDARAWAKALFEGFGWDQCAREPVAFRCRCSRDRMMAMLSSLPKGDMAELAEGSEPLELVCDYCHTKYYVRPGELRELMVEPS